MKQFTCDYCHKKFLRWPSERKGHPSIFCSRKCRASFISGKNNPNFSNAFKEYICKYCGKKFNKFQSYGKHIFCSRKCHHKSLVKNDSTKSYRHIPNSNHPRANSEKRVKLCILNLEKKIGRFLLPNEIAHHIDGNIRNDNLDNLYLMEISHHRTYHINLAKTYKKWKLNITDE